MSHGSGLHPSSGSLFHVVHQAPQSGPAPLCAVIFHLFPPAHSVQDAHCICLPQALHLPLSLAGMFYLHSPCFIPSLPSSPCLPITSHRILSDRPIYTAVLPSTLSSLCPESPKNRAGLFPHWALTQDNFIPFWALVFMLSSVTSGQHDGSHWECATFPLSKCRVARAWWGRWGESW